MQFDLHNHINTVLSLAPQTITSTGSPQDLIGASVDLQFFQSAEVVAVLGDIDELGGSPVGAAKIELELEHSDDDITFTDVALADVLGPTSVTTGIVASSTGDTATLEVGYVGGKRFIRPRLLSTSLTNGGPVSIVVIKGNPRHAPK